MKNRMRGAITLTAVVAMMASSISVYAAGNSTTITVNVLDSSTYELVIPAATTVSDYGWTELASPIKVKGRLTTNKVVDVTFSSANEYKFVNEDKTKSMAYTLQQTSDGAAVEKITFSPADVTATGGEGKTLGVYVTQDAWNAVPGGTYTDVVTFTAAMNDVTN